MTRKKGKKNARKARQGLHNNAAVEDLPPANTTTVAATGNQGTEEDTIEYCCSTRKEMRQDGRTVWKGIRPIIGSFNDQQLRLHKPTLGKVTREERAFNIRITIRNSIIREGRWSDLVDCERGFDSVALEDLIRHEERHLLSEDQVAILEAHDAQARETAASVFTVVPTTTEVPPEPPSASEGDDASPSTSGSRPGINYLDDKVRLSITVSSPLLGKAPRVAPNKIIADSIPITGKLGIARLAQKNDGTGNLPAAAAAGNIEGLEAAATTNLDTTKLVDERDTGTEKEKEETPLSRRTLQKRAIASGEKQSELGEKESIRGESAPDLLLKVAYTMDQHLRTREEIQDLNLSPPLQTHVVHVDDASIAMNVGPSPVETHVPISPIEIETTEVEIRDPRMPTPPPSPQMQRDDNVTAEKSPPKEVEGQNVDSNLRTTLPRANEHEPSQPTDRNSPIIPSPPRNEDQEQEPQNNQQDVPISPVREVSQQTPAQDQPLRDAETEPVVLGDSSDSDHLIANPKEWIRKAKVKSTQLFHSCSSSSSDSSDDSDVESRQSMPRHGDRRGPVLNVRPLKSLQPKPPQQKPSRPEPIQTETTQPETSPSGQQLSLEVSAKLALLLEKFSSPQARPQSPALSSEMATAREKVRALMTMSSEQFCHGSHLQELRDSLQVLSEGGFFNAGSADMIKNKFAAVEHDLTLAKKATQELEAGNKVAEIVDGLKASLLSKTQKCQNLQREVADLDQEIVKVEKRLATLKKPKEDKGVQQLFQEIEADAVVYEGLESQLDKARSESPGLEALCRAGDAGIDALRAVLRPFFP